MTVDVAFGGMFYVIADAAPLGVRLVPEDARELVRLGEMIKAAAREQLPVSHPDNPEIRDITIAQISGEPMNASSSRRNTVIVSTGTLDWSRPKSWTGVLDRSPCGTGTCAKMATLHAKGKLGFGQDFIHEGILGTTFTGRLIEKSRRGLQSGCSDSFRTGLDYRLCAICCRSRRSVPEWFHGWGYLGLVDVIVSRPAARDPGFTAVGGWRFAAFGQSSLRPARDETKSL